MNAHILKPASDLGGVSTQKPLWTAHFSMVFLILKLKSNDVFSALKDKDYKPAQGKYTFHIASPSRS